MNQVEIDLLQIIGLSQDMAVSKLNANVQFYSTEIKYTCILIFALKGDFVYQGNYVQAEVIDDD